MIAAYVYLALTRCKHIWIVDEAPDVPVPDRYRKRTAAGRITRGLSFFFR